MRVISEIKDMYEFVYNANGDDQWIKRADMPITRGHASSSTNKYGCGFIIAGGTKNGGGKVLYRCLCVNFYALPLSVPLSSLTGFL